MDYTITHGDMTKVLPGLGERSFDSVVTDTPYHLTSILQRYGSATSAPPKGHDAYKRTAAGFLGQTWDGGDVAFRPETWAEVLRVLKPGGYCLAFGASRTHHRLACALEDAGFIIRDTISWIYATGYPKSRDLAKDFDRRAGVQRKVVGTQKGPGYAKADVVHGAQNREVWAWDKLDPEPVSDLAKQWDGWGTALRPAVEFITVAQRPMIGSYAENVEKHGVGGLHIDAVRLPAGASDPYWRNLPARRGHEHNRTRQGQQFLHMTTGYGSDDGRWPPNVLLTHSQDCTDMCAPGCPVAEFERLGVSSSFPAFRVEAKPGLAETEDGLDDLETETTSRLNPGGLSNDPKWEPKERKNNHATKKPVKLMRWLLELCTPPGGITLDPFLGSGTTMVAAIEGGYDCYGIEINERNSKIAIARRDSQLQRFRPSELF